MSLDSRRFTDPLTSGLRPMGDSSADRDPVELLAAEFIERLRRGEAVTIDQYARRYPQLANDIRQLFPTIAAMEGLRGLLSAPAPAATTELKVQRLGDFRIVRELGRGGMGIVYEAEQESLCRRVAVKVLSPKLLASDKHVARFRVEAQTAANLHHTNIVPVFGVGEHDGLHYYVMQYIHGAGLDQAAHSGSGDRTPTIVLKSQTADSLQLTFESTGNPVAVTPAAPIVIPATPAERMRWAVDVARQVARALAYAHEQGVLHRDIKPGNLLLDPHGVVRVTDFGLATVVAEGREGAEGEIVGTLRYMAPEQFASRSDARTDIYSLGITLYELIIAAPAFAEPNRSKLIAQVRQGQLAPLVQRAPTVNRDLAAIVARATAVDPNDRYPTAQEFADDLERWLARRPVSARPISLVGHLVRWANRNPVLATLQACVVLLLASIAVVSTIGQQRVQSALQRESLEHHRADANSKMASETLDRIFAKFDPPTNLQLQAQSPTASARWDDSLQPVLSPETAALMQNLLRYYDELASQGSDDPALRTKAASARRRVADIRQRLGEYDAAILAYAEARARQNELSGLGVDVRGELARIHNELGRCYSMIDRADDARDAHTTALQILDQWHLAEPQHLQVLYELARTHYLLGRSLRPGQNPTMMPLDMFVEAPANMQPQASAEAHEGAAWDDPRPKREARSGPPSDNVRRRPPPPHLPSTPEHLYAAIKLLRTVVSDATAGPPALRQLLAACYRELAHDHLQLRTSADIAAERNAIELLEALVQAAPRNTDYRYELMETLAQFDIFSATAESPLFEQALKHLTQAQEHADQLMQARPDVEEYVMSVIHVHFKTGVLQHQLGQRLQRKERTQALGDALRSMRRAVSFQRTLMIRHPDQVAYRAWLARFLIAEAAVLHDQQETDKAEKLLNEAETQIGRLNRGATEQQIAPLRRFLQQQRVALATPVLPPTPPGGEPLGPPPRPRPGFGPRPLDDAF